MRTKRFLSLLLAVAMLAGLTISASAAEISKVYLTDDFPASVYTNANYYKAAGGVGTIGEDGKYTYSGFDHDGDPETPNIANDFRINSSGIYWNKTSTYANATAVTPDQLRALGMYYYMTNWNSGSGISHSTNSRGNSAMETAFGTSFWGNAQYMHRILPERWESEAGEAFVFTTEIEPVKTTNTIAGTTVSISGNLYELHASTVAEGLATDIKTAGVAIGITKTTVTIDEEAGTTGTSWVAKFGGVEIPDSACNRVYDYTTVLTPSEDGKLSRQNYVDGVALGSAASVAANAVEGYDFKAIQGVSYRAAKARAYSLSLAEGAFNVARTTGGLVAKDAASIPVKFSQPVEASTFDADAVTITGVSGEDTVTLVNGEDFEVTAVTEEISGTEIYSTANIIFLEELDEATDYTITFPAAVKNTAAVELGAYNTIAFTTPTPDIKMSNFNIIKGWGTDAETAAEAFVADGTLQLASLELTNTTETNKNVAVIYAVYASNGQLTDVVYADDVLTGNATTEIGAGVKLTAAGSVKAFVWDGISSLKPHSEATIRDIVAAE